MRHQRRRRKLGVVSSHRTAMLRNILRALVLHKRIETTYARAKEVSSFADKAVTIAKREGLHARRLLISKVRDPKIADILIKKIAPLLKERAGGYTRVLRLGFRASDGAEKALLEWTAVFEAPAKKDSKKKSKSVKAVEAADEKKTVKTASKTAEKKTKKAAKEVEETKEKPEKKETNKKGGFLGTLRKFLKGDEQ